MLRFVKFRVYCGVHDQRGLFVYVRVFATKGEMLRALNVEAKAWGLPRYNRKTQGAMQGYKSSTTPACIGSVNLYVRGLTHETVTHEFGHATFAYRERLGKLDAWRVEEVFCYALGRMVNRFVQRVAKLGFMVTDRELA